MTFLCMARPWRHPTTGKLYFRKAIPEHLRKAAGMREFKRSLNTSDAREGRKRHSAIAGEYDALIERLEAPPIPTAEAEQVQTIAVTPGDLHRLAGGLWRWFLERYAASPAPDEAFSKAASSGPWGATSEPWSGQRYQLQQARRARVPAAEQGIVAKFVGDFLAERRIGLGSADRSAFSEAARDAIDGALGDLHRRFRGDHTESTTLPRYPQEVPANIFREMIYESPAAPLRAQFWADVKAGGEARADAVGRLAVGSMFWGSAAMLAAEGVITGKGPADPILAAQWKLDGKQSFSPYVPDVLARGSSRADHGVTDCQSD